MQFNGNTTTSTHTYIHIHIGTFIPAHSWHLSLLSHKEGEIGLCFVDFASDTNNGRNNNNTSRQQETPQTSANAKCETLTLNLRRKLNLILNSYLHSSHHRLLNKVSFQLTTNTLSETKYTVSLMFPAVSLEETARQRHLCCLHQLNNWPFFGHFFICLFVFFSPSQIVSVLATSIVKLQWKSTRYSESHTSEIQMFFYLSLLWINFTRANGCLWCV